MTPIDQPDAHTAIKAIFHRIRTRALRDAKINLQHVNEAEEAVEALLAERIQTARAQGHEEGRIDEAAYWMQNVISGTRSARFEARIQTRLAQLKAGEEV